MSDPRIVCPKCRPAIRVTDELPTPLKAVTRKQFDRSQALPSARPQLRKQKGELAKAREAIDDRVARRLA